jgi:hypothetical protein
MPWGEPETKREPATKGIEEAEKEAKARAASIDDELARQIGPADADARLTFDAGACSLAGFR